MNTEQLKTAEDIAKKYTGQFPDVEGRKISKTWGELRSMMENDISDFASQESNKALSEFKDKLRKDYEDRILLCENVIKQNPRNTGQCLIAICEGVITEYRYLIDKL